MESSPECSVRAKTSCVGAREKGSFVGRQQGLPVTEFDRRLGASLDEIFGFVSMKYTEGTISKVKVIHFEL